MTMAKNSFVLYHNYREILTELTDEQLGKLFRALFDYEIDRTEPKFSGELKIAFGFIKKDLDINLVKYDNICKRNRENGQNGGAPIGNQNARKQPKQPKQPEYDNDNEYDSNIVSKKESKKINNKLEYTSHAHARESYDEIFENCNIAGLYKLQFIEFIRHCQLNGHLLTNDKLMGIIVKLDMTYGKDDGAKMKSLEKAISGGYFDIKR